MAYKEFERTDRPNNTELVTDMIANQIYQYDEGANSAILRSSFVAVEQLRQKGIVKEDDIYSIKLGVMLAILLQETVDLDVGEELVSHIENIDL